VLIVTGGLLTSQERSLIQATRKWLAHWRGARSAWLDLKVKLVMAEPLFASRLQALRLAMSRGRRRDVIAFSEEEPTRRSTPSLTEVVLATLLERAGLSYEVIEMEELFIDPGRAHRLLGETGCVFLSSTYLHDLSELAPVVRRLKRPHNRIVLGGALAGILPRDWPGMPEVDVVAIGYGELLVDSLAGWIRSGYSSLQPPAGGRLESRSHSLFLYSGAPEGSDLDFLPAPDWGLAMRDHRTRYRMIYYESVRGCPYRCSFCNYPYLFADTKFRFRSARRMAEDWQAYVSDLGVEYITCLDSLFTVPRPRLQEFCRLLVDRGVRVKWICYARADDLADEKTVVMMKEAGAHQVQIGIESGDARLLENMDKACTVEANVQALRNCRKHSLTTVISLIVGFPGETPATLERTYRFLESTPPDFYFLATFSTRVAGVPLLRPENRDRFGLRVLDNPYTMAPYWEHATMSCVEVGNHVRALDRRLMANRVALNAILFYPGMLDYRPEHREALLDRQKRATEDHRLLHFGFDVLNRWVDRRLRRDVRAHFAEPRRERGTLPEQDLRQAARDR
jgi:radical SAM superfamily enzyme YgiQ (UPF0313 family)